MLQYLINCTAIWLLSLIIFDVFLRGESYHAYNRLYLVSTFLLGVFIPLFSWDSGSAIYTSRISRPVLGVIAAKQTVVTSVVGDGSPLDVIQTAIIYIYFIGVIISLTLMALEAVKIVRLYHLGSKFREGPCVIIETGKDHGPFSLFNCVFVSARQNYSDEEWGIVLAHEQLHGLMFHFIDVLFFQLARIVFWFHPLVYLYQRKMLLLHEYQADRVCGARPKFYGQFLVEQALLQSAPTLSHSFNRSPIKNRIVMLTRKSSAASKLKMLLFAPLALVCLVCFSKDGFSHQFRKVKNTYTGSGNQIAMTPQSAPDTFVVTDPVTGAQTMQVTSVDPKPKTLNGQRIVDVDAITVRPLFKSKDFTFRNYLKAGILDALATLPDGSYNLNIGYIVLDSKGKVAYYEFSGISRYKFSHNDKVPIPEDLKKQVDKKIEQVLADIKAQPAQLNGKNVPVIFLDDKVRNSVEVKDHKVTNWP